MSNVLSRNVKEKHALEPDGDYDNNEEHNQPMELEGESYTEDESDPKELDSEIEDRT